MIYVDSSVLLAELLDEDRIPPRTLWQSDPVSSRLAQYEVWTRIHRGDLGRSHGQKAGRLLDRVTLIDMLPSVLERALEPLPLQLRTLDALHLATAAYLHRSEHNLQLASYDNRFVAAARTLNIKIAEL